MEKQQAVIFDFDGTIADSLMLVITIFRELTGWQGGRTPEEISRLRRLPLSKVIKEVHIPLYQVPSLLVRGRKMMAHRITEVPLVEGMTEVIKTLHEQDYRLLVMSSNSTQNVERFLRFHGLNKYFSGVYGGVGLLNKASSLRRITRQNHIDRALCVYVGDEHRDIEAAHKVPVRCIAVSWGYNDPALLRAHKPFALAQHPSEILAALTPKS